MNRLSLVCLAVASFSGAAMAQTTASGVINYTLSGSLYTYNISLTNTGSTAVGTLWYAWIPGEDYLPIKPISASSPTGWTLNETTGSGFGTGMQWVASAGSTLAAGATLSGFSFTTTTTPAELAGPSTFDPKNPVGTSFVYQGSPFSGGSEEIVINPAPEPAPIAFATLGLGSLALLIRRRMV